MQNNKFIDAVEVGKKIKEFRLKAGYTLERLAEIVELSAQQIQKYENGVSCLNTNKLQELAAALNVSMFSFFVGLDEYPILLSDEERRLVEAFRSVKEDEIRNGYLLVLEGHAKK
jgi:transcriptional regulator with XRE-family HTH domain